MDSHLVSLSWQLVVVVVVIIIGKRANIIAPAGGCSLFGVKSNISCVSSSDSGGVVVVNYNNRATRYQPLLV